MAFTKAVIEVILEKKTEKITVQFNPAEYSMSEGANYGETTIPGLDGPLVQYISGAASTLNMTLMLDTFQTPSNLPGSDETVPTDVSLLTARIVGLTRIVGSLHRPPLCRFLWGSLQFYGFVKSVNQTYTMFMEDGMPVRAKLDVVFQAYVDAVESKLKTPFESPDRTKRRVLRQGMRLWNIAWEEYGDAGLWRTIVKENGLMSPLDALPGQVLKIPAL